ncbi:RNA-guided endonuclease InsQ/TnpB family protein [Aromatoleum anaerobium]|uniref:RNA-guided endonuclease InsQ/TnpB family protein n=1 Tax=Aromatoleum anaerobium TaxID=182180 RepID=UPI00248C1ECC|nr:transposase [Aromatoleum anaerobium]MCK0509125.1 helix-turn-helix domain-containing protein [Aromatoleum anaerobium]
MQRLQAFKFELSPDGQQERQMRRFAGSCRFVFNKALALQKERYEQGEKKLGYAGLCKRLTEWRNSPDTGWLSGAPVHPLQQTLKDLERAYANFFLKRADFPRFKKKGQADSFRYPDPKQIKLEQANSRLLVLSKCFDNRNYPRSTIRQGLPPGSATCVAGRVLEFA